MEIQAYIKFLQRRWKTILVLTLFTLGATAFWTMNMAPVYESTATFVVRISSSSDEKNRISALNTLMSSDDIPATYAKVANSRLIKRQAAEQLQLSSSQRSVLSSDSQLIAGTNVLEVTAKGNDPTLVMNYANAVGGQMVAYAATLYETFELVALDDAPLPRIPTQPDLTTNLVMGGVLGLFLGIGIALLREYLQTSANAESAASSPEDATKLLELPQFIAELETEISQLLVSQRPLSVALLEITVPGSKGETRLFVQQEAVRLVSLSLVNHLQRNDKIGFYDENTLAFLLPDTSKTLASAKLNEWLQLIKGSPIELGALGQIRMNCSGVVVTHPAGSDQEQTTAEDLLLQAKNSLSHPSSGKANKQAADQNSVVTVS